MLVIPVQTGIQSILLGCLVKTVGLARQASFFLLLVQKKEAKEKDPLLPRRLRRSPALLAPAALRA